MLTRDFGFKIYKAFNYLNYCKDTEEKSKETTEDGEKTQDQKSESGDKKSSSKKNEESDTESRNKREKESKDKIKYVTAYPDLLLSFCYFDQSQCGYIFEKGKFNF
jgi:negative regulator of genetic competence, sporulation and motility